MKRIITLVLTLAALLVLTVTACADTIPGTAKLTITPTDTKVSGDTATVTYSVTVTPPEGKELGVFSVQLQPSDGMTLSQDTSGITYGDGSLSYSPATKKGIFEIYGYTAKTGYFAAAGTTEDRRMSKEATVLTIQATMPANKSGTYTLNAEFIAALDGSGDVYTAQVSTTPVTVSGGDKAPVADKTPVITATAGGKTAQCTVTVVNCLHTSKSLVAAKAATCTEKGMKEHYKCDTCSALFETEDSTTPVAASTLELPVIDHTFTDVAEKAATCTEKGNVAYKHCSTCGKNYDAEGKLLDTVETDALGHDMTFMTAVPATCKDTGTKAYFHCERCTKNFVDQNGQKELTDLTTAKNPTNHAGGTKQVNVKPSSHVNQEDGYTGDTKCLGCGEIIAKGETIPWGTHVWSDWKHDADKHWKECTVKGCTEKNKEAAHQPDPGTPNCVSSATCQVCGYEVAPTNSKIHTKIVKVEAKAATCTENGNIEHYKCTGCGKLFSDEAGATEIAAKDVVIPAAHKLTPVAEKPSNCRVPGTAAYDKCDVCGKMFDKDGKEITAPATLPLVAHTWDTTKWLANKDGHYRECKVCGIADTVITPHTPGAEATATTPQTCTDCGYIIKPATSHKEHTKGNLMSDATSHWYACTGCSEQLEKANHTVTSWTVDKAATTTEEGLRHGNCSVCQHVVYEKLAKINNTPTTPSKPGRPSGTKTVQSGKTFDAGVGVYVGLSILSLTGSAVVIGKKRKTR